MRLNLPSFFAALGVGANNRAKLRLNPDGRFVLDDLRIGPIDANIDGADVGLQDLEISYSSATGEWRGTGSLCFFVACLDARDTGKAPPGGVVIQGDSLKYLFARAVFPAPGVPLFPGVFLNDIGAGLELNPTQLLGSTTLHAAGIFQINGNLVFAFPSSAAPAILSLQKTGKAFPAKFYGHPFTTATFGVGGTASLDIPFIDDDLDLGNAYLLYSFPGYAAFGGGVEFGFLYIVSIEGGAAGEFNFGNGRFDLGVGGELCVINDPLQQRPRARVRCGDRRLRDGVRLRLRRHQRRWRRDLRPPRLRHQGVADRRVPVEPVRRPRGLRPARTARRGPARGGDRGW